MSFDRDEAQIPMIAALLIGGHNLAPDLARNHPMAGHKTPRHPSRLLP